MIDLAPLVLEIDFDAVEEPDLPSWKLEDADYGLDDVVEHAVFSISVLLAHGNVIPQGPSEVVQGLYLGTEVDAHVVERLGVNYVLNLAANSNGLEISGGRQTMLVMAKDDRGYPLLEKHFEICHHFIQEGRRHGGVFVHCEAGVNRSVAIVAAYLMWEEKWPLTTAVSILKEQRGIILRNTSFVSELVTLARRLQLLDV